MPRSTGSRRTPTPSRAGLAAYGESDLLCYRAEGPAPLVARQAAALGPDPRLGAQPLRRRVRGRHRRHPQAAARRDGRAARRGGRRARRRSQLAGLSPLVTVSGSLIIALALAEGAIGLDAAWAAATLDEQWQAEQWGEDAEAAAALAARRAEFEAAARFLSLL